MIQPEVVLWRTVINLALMDASGTSKTGMHNEDEKVARTAEARQWLLGFGRDFRDVCQWADIDPNALRDRARRMAGNGWRPWRLAA